MKKKVSFLVAALITVSLCHTVCIADANGVARPAASDETAQDVLRPAASDEAAQDVLRPAASDEAAQVIAKPGDNGGAVSVVQQMLTRLGYLSGGVDGSFGDTTEAAVKKFQAENNLSSDGIVTKAVYDLMKQKAQAAAASDSLRAVAASDIYDEFVANGIAAEVKYKGRTIQVMGRVDSIGRSISGTAYVRVKADDAGVAGVTCFFSDANLSKLANLEREQIVVIQGTCGTRDIADLTMEDCILVDKPIRVTTDTTYYYSAPELYYDPYYDPYYYRYRYVPWYDYYGWGYEAGDRDWEYDWYYWEEESTEDVAAE